MSYFSSLVNSSLVNSSLVNNSLVTYNPLSPNNSGKSPRCAGQRSVEKFADKNRKAGYSFAAGFENNTLIVQRFPSSSYSS